MPGHAVFIPSLAVVSSVDAFQAPALINITERV
jgi:hypothetical protein